MNLALFLVKRINEFTITPEIALRATRHISKTFKENLFSEIKRELNKANGHLFEAIIYEMILDLSTESKLIKSIVRKGADILKRQPKAKLGQNGFFIDSLGHIVFRGNGQDLSEFDIVMFDNNSNPLIVEIVRSGYFLDTWEKEVTLKREILKAYLGAKKATMLLVSSSDISDNTDVITFLRSRKTYYTRTSSYPDISSMLSKEMILSYSGKKSAITKLIGLNELPRDNEFDYVEEHDSYKHQLIEVARKKKKIGSIQTHFVPKVIIGAFYPSVYKYLGTEYSININEHDFDKDELKEYFQKIILAINLPDLRPVLYLRVKKKYLKKKSRTAYLKLGPQSANTFLFERNIPRFVGFVKWLDQIEPSLGKTMVKLILVYYLRDEVFTPHIKHRNANIVNQGIRK